MKKNLLFALSSLCALAASAAVEVAGGSGTPANLNDEQYRNQDVILLPSTESPAQGAYFSGDTESTTTGTTLKSMTVKPSEEGPREWVLSRNITLDANGSESDYILDMGTKKTTYWLPTSGWFTIDNTGASTSPVKVRFGDFLFQNGSSSYFNFYTDAEVSGTSLSLGLGNGYEGKLTMRIGNSALGKNANVVFNVGTTSFQKKASLNIQRGSSLTIAQGATFTFTGSSTFDVFGTLKYENTSAFLEIASNMTIANTGNVVLSNAFEHRKGRHGDNRRALRRLGGDFNGFDWQRKSDSQRRKTQNCIQERVGGKCDRALRGVFKHARTFRKKRNQQRVFQPEHKACPCSDGRGCVGFV